MAINDGPDRIIYGVDLTGAHEISVGEDQNDDGTIETSAQLELNEEFKYGHQDTGLISLPDGADRPLFQDVEDALNGHSTLDNSYVIEPITPSGGSIGASALRVRTDDVNDHEFSLGFNGGDEIESQWLGFDSDTVFSSASGSRQQIEAPYTPRVFCQLVTLAPTDRASGKPYDEDAEIYTSHGDELTNFQVQHGARNEKRVLEYSEVPAAVVRAGKADDSSHADNAGVPQNDPGAALYWAWRWMRQNRHFIVVHNDGQVGFDVDSHDWELGVLEKPQRDAWSGLVGDTPARRNPEAWDFEIRYTRTGDGNLTIR